MDSSEVRGLSFRYDVQGARAEGWTYMRFLEACVLRPASDMNNAGSRATISANTDGMAYDVNVVRDGEEGFALV